MSIPIIDDKIQERISKLEKRAYSLFGDNFIIQINLFTDGDLRISAINNLTEDICFRIWEDDNNILINGLDVSTFNPYYDHIR